MQAIALSRAPVIASHSSTHTLNNVCRNLDDEELRTIKKNEGAVQAVAFRTYVDAEKSPRNRRALQELRANVAEELGITTLGRRAHGRRMTIDPSTFVLNRQ